MDEIHIILPKQELGGVSEKLMYLTEQLDKLPDVDAAHGFLGGEFGYGTEYENDTFMMKPFCWCMKKDCPWCLECYCEGHYKDENNLESYIETFKCDNHEKEPAPNFWYKPSGYRMNIYKYFGRGEEEGWYQPRKFTNPSEIKDAIDGILFSDGNVSIPGRCFHNRFQMTSKSRQFCEFVASALPVEYKITGPHKSTYQNGGVSSYYLLRTGVNKVWDSYRERWYKDNKKVIPRDFRINPTTMLFGYLGDGCLVNPKGERSYCSISTCAFSEVEAEGIVERLNAAGFNARVQRQRQYYEVKIGKDSSPYFLDWLGGVPFTDYAYKWALKTKPHKPKLPDNWLKECIESIQP